MALLGQKSCLVTGATSGIGKEIVLGLARMGAQVTLVGRNKDKCESTMQWVNSNVATQDNRVSYLVADLSLQESVRQLARDYSQRNQKLDILVNNAGIFAAKHITTKDGLELTLAVNHLAPFLLTNLLLDRILAAKPSRIISTSSIAHKGAQIDFDDLQFEKRPYNGIKAYSQSKLANILFTKELARKLEGSGVTTNCYHPGAVRTNLVHENSPWYYRLVWRLGSPFFLSPAGGADTAIYLASDDSVQKESGKYFAKRRHEQPSREANDLEAAKRLWEISEKLTGL